MEAARDLDRSDHLGRKWKIAGPVGVVAGAIAVFREGLHYLNNGVLSKSNLKYGIETTLVAGIVTILWFLELRRKTR